MNWAVVLSVAALFCAVAAAWYAYWQRIKAERAAQIADWQRIKAERAAQISLACWRAVKLRGYVGQEGRDAWLLSLFAHAYDELIAHDNIPASWPVLCKLASDYGRSAGGRPQQYEFDELREEVMP